MAEAWQLEGTIVIACNCDFGCPCNFNAPPTHGDCEGGWVWLVERGRWGEVDLAGVAFSLFADWPGAIHEGGGRAVAFLDDRLEDAQRVALTELVLGRAGGPWGLFIGTYELEGPVAVRHEIEIAGPRTRVRVGSVVELSTEPIRNPVSGAEVSSTVLLPSGLVTHEASMLASSTFRVEAGVAYDHSGRYAALGAFAYRGP